MLEPHPPRTHSLPQKHRIQSPLHHSQMPRPRQSHANRNGKKKRILSDRSHLRKIRQTPTRRTNQSHNPRTHAHPKIIRRRLHTPRQSPQQISQRNIQKILRTKKRRLLNRMAMKKIIYYIDGKKKTVSAKVVRYPLEKALGLMFQKNPQPLFFTSNKINWNPITSYFCKPFKAIWLDDKFHATKVIDVKTWKFNISGYGKYLLEIPLNLDKSKF